MTVCQFEIAINFIVVFTNGAAGDNDTYSHKIILTNLAGRLGWKPVKPGDWRDVGEGCREVAPGRSALQILYAGLRVVSSRRPPLLQLASFDKKMYNCIIGEEILDMAITLHDPNTVYEEDGYERLRARYAADHDEHGVGGGERQLRYDAACSAAATVLKAMDIHTELQGLGDFGILSAEQEELINTWRIDHDSVIRWAFATQETRSKGTIWGFTELEVVDMEATAQAGLDVLAQPPAAQ